ncbi:monofunctional biosynthetic peptidoglycan transglycosylase [Nitratireductor aquimarinus]|uniref:monofunctional biosynthetic peptidoglycan transglycosylase n=1 Tax=Alphaproteobacteria TaxID=28211 RepID=UPI0019D399C8|nr:monofunctional biosynthetic peptidoglycan transglycosylase [Tritonibacter mobilis]MBN7757920.1 monofunctional biosynthetic peptidoglycan transglycosylase [Nitratireductor aquimarinus]MBN7762384.1 monofunctional biosynthetic peptidoglycan transglycosylase [Nitratireductor aquibiodomus]MBY6022712.1 monofunctional biosynthetic peptidoglycan transglycosylase [Nitratireductor sp. DP7N14-4]MBN8244353.1 monofunctional biosynthetic peptidoglycan transglycosylase [Nitratireductor aquimarinus]MBY6000
MSGPTVDPEKRTTNRRGGRRGRKAAGRRAGGRAWLGWFARRVLLVLVVLALIPALLTLLYRVPVVHPISTLMMRDLVTFTGYDRDWKSLEEMGDLVPHSVMMSEDGQFCAHDGIDWAALNLVINDALSGEKTRGASTIPMQTVKNLYLWQGRSFVRKGLELPLAIYLDLVLPKRRIMEIYLNIVEWGPNIYGAEAAAQHYFGRPASQLSRRQAALLAVTLPNPLERNPAKPSSGLNRLAAKIEQRARKAGGYVGCLKP